MDHPLNAPLKCDMFTSAVVFICGAYRSVSCSLHSIVWCVVSDVSREGCTTVTSHPKIQRCIAEDLNCQNQRFEIRKFCSFVVHFFAIY